MVNIFFFDSSWLFSSEISNHNIFSMFDMKDTQEYENSDCFSNKYLIWQPHNSGIGSNIILGYSFANIYAMYTKRVLIIGNPPKNWLYLNKFPVEQKSNVGVDKSTLGMWNKMQENNFWSYYFPSSLIHRCNEEISNIGGNKVSSENELMLNEAMILTVNLDQGPDYMKLLKNNKINGQAKIGTFPITPDRNSKNKRDVMNFMSKYSDNVYTGFLIRYL